MGKSKTKRLAHFEKELWVKDGIEKFAVGDLQPNTVWMFLASRFEGHLKPMGHPFAQVSLALINSNKKWAPMGIEFPAKIPAKDLQKSVFHGTLMNLRDVVWRQAAVIRQVGQILQTEGGPKV